jgi:hypothetical protein
MNTKETMMRLAKAALLAAPVVALTCVGAPRANAAAAADKPLSVQVGVGWPTDSDVRKGTSNTGIHAGLGYQLPTMGQGQTAAKASLDLDFNNTTGHGNRLTTYSLEAAERIPMSSGPASASGPYVGLGVGAVHIDAHGGGESKTKTQFGGKALIGMSMGDTFVELSYNYNGKVSIGSHDFKADTVNLSVGTHF